MIGHRIQNLPRLLPRSVQFKLDLRAVGGRGAAAARPLGDLNSAMRDLDLGGDEILQLVQQRALIGFNIAVHPTGRGELRILTRSLEYFREHSGRALPVVAWPEVFQLVFPAATPPLALHTLTGLELTQALNCSRGHVGNLAAHHFEITQPARQGRGHTPRFKAASVEGWLKGRLL